VVAAAAVEAAVQLLSGILLHAYDVFGKIINPFKALLYFSGDREGIDPLALFLEGTLTSISPMMEVEEH
jgi:hypothetical protein